MFEAIALAFGLAMDATAISAARGLGGKHPHERFLLPLVFGLFQAAMAGGGWALGHVAGPYIEAYQGYVACALLVLIGGKMLADAVWGGDEAAEAERRPGLWLYVGLGVATSIDAAAAGLTLPLVPISPVISLALIGGITAGCSLVGYLLGRSLGSRVGGKLELLGGVVLIGLGIKMLIQGL